MFFIHKPPDMSSILKSFSLLFFLVFTLSLSLYAQTPGAGCNVPGRGNGINGKYYCDGDCIYISQYNALYNNGNSGATNLFCAQLYNDGGDCIPECNDPAYDKILVTIRMTTPVLL